MRSVMIVLCVGLASTAVFAGATLSPAPTPKTKTFSYWADLAAAKVDSITNERERADAWVRLAGIYTTAGEPKQAAKYLAKASAFVNAQADANAQADVLLDIARVQVRMNDHVACRQMLQQLEAVFSRAPKGHVLDRSIWPRAALYYFRIGDAEAAANIASKVRDNREWAMMLLVQSDLFVKNGKWATALQVTELVEQHAKSDDYCRAMIRQIRAFVQAGRGDWRSAEAVVNGMTDDYTRALAWLDLADVAGKVDRRKLRGELLARAAKLADGVENPVYRDTVWQGLAMAYVYDGLWDKAQQAVLKESMGQARLRTWANLGLAQALAGKTALAKATLQAVQKAYDAWQPVEGVGKEDAFVTRLLQGLCAVTGDCKRANQLYDRLEDKPWVRSRIILSAILTDNCPALVKRAATMDSPHAVEII